MEFEIWYNHVWPTRVRDCKRRVSAWVQKASECVSECVSAWVRGVCNAWVWNESALSPWQQCRFLFHTLLEKNVWRKIELKAWLLRDGWCSLCLMLSLFDALISESVTLSSHTHALTRCSDYIVPVVKKQVCFNLFSAQLKGTHKPRTNTSLWRDSCLRCTTYGAVECIYGSFACI